VQVQFYLRMALLLASAQVILGLTGYALRRYPWPALVVTLLFLWLLVRAATVMRGEVSRAQRKGIPVVPAAAASLVAVLWQLPGLAVLPLWVPDWIWSVWQGWALPVPGVLGRLLGMELNVAPWLWGAWVVEVLLFVGAASRREVRRVRRVAVPKVKAAGDAEWVPARRYTGKNRQRPDEDQEAE